MTNISTSPETDDNSGNENPYTVRRDRPERRELLRARLRSSLSFPTQDSTLVSYGSTDIESNITRPIEVGNSEPPSRTGTPTLHNFRLSSPSDQSGNSSLWSATSPQSASSNTTPQRSNQTSSSNTSVSVLQVEQTYSLQPPRNTALSPSSFIPEIRLPSSHPGRTRSTPILNPNPHTKSRTNEHTYLFALNHKTWNPPPPLYGPTNLGDTLTNWSRSRLTNTLNLTHRQRNAALNVLATPSLELIFNTTIKYDTVFNHPFHATTPSLVTTTLPAPFICIDFIYKFDRYTKQTLGFATFYNPHTGLSYTCRFN